MFKITFVSRQGKLIDTLVKSDSAYMAIKAVAAREDFEILYSYQRLVD
jgi:hypothetical protein